MSVCIATFYSWLNSPFVCHTWNSPLHHVHMDLSVWWRQCLLPRLYCPLFHCSHFLHLHLSVSCTLHLFCLCGSSFLLQYNVYEAGQRRNYAVVDGCNAIMYWEVCLCIFLCAMNVVCYIFSHSFHSLFTLCHGMLCDLGSLSSRGVYGPLPPSWSSNNKHRKLLSLDKGRKRTTQMDREFVHLKKSLLDQHFIFVPCVFDYCNINLCYLDSRCIIALIYT